MWSKAFEKLNQMQKDVPAVYKIIQYWDTTRNEWTYLCSVVPAGTDFVLTALKKQYPERDFRVIKGGY